MYWSALAFYTTNIGFRSDILLKLRENVLANDAEVSKLRKEVTELEADLSVTKRALVTAQSDCEEPYSSFYVLL